MNNYACIYVGAHAHNRNVCAWLCVCMCVHDFVHMYACTCMHAHVGLCMYVCMNVCMYVCVWVCVRACVRACMHVCKHIWIYESKCVCTLYVRIPTSLARKLRDFWFKFFQKHQIWLICPIWHTVSIFAGHQDELPLAGRHFEKKQDCRHFNPNMYDTTF